MSIFIFVSACGKPTIPSADLTDDLPSGQGSAKLPTIPSFEITGDVKRYRVQGSKYAGTQVTIKGYVTWVYDCVSEQKQPGESDDVVRKRIAAQPELCKKAHFYIGDSASTPPDQSLWVLGVASPLRPDQKNIMDPEAIATHNAKIVPYKLGDQVEVLGNFEKKKENLYGLLRFESMRNLSVPVEPAAEAATE